MEWISVNDRLPELGALVLLYLSNGKVNKMTTGKRYKSVDKELDNLTGKFCIGFDETFPDFLEEDFVTHWMSMPEPPEEETQQ